MCSKRNIGKAIFLIIVCVNTNGQNNSMIYILVWSKEFAPFPYHDMGQQCFIKNKCAYQNCFVTHDKRYFNDIKRFDAIVFNAMNIKEDVVPTERSAEQKYVFVSKDPPGLCPMPSRYDGFFNYTFTYQLDSDIIFRFFVIRDDKGNIIGPKEGINWIDVKDMKATSKDVIKKLENKKKAAAWFVTNCRTPGQREEYVKKLVTELAKYSLAIDIYGICGYFECPMFTKECYDKLESDYYFYLSFENSLCKDYVSEKLLTALKHYAVPVVYGGANYTSFMPKGIYLDANVLEPKELARIMNDTIHNKNKYYDFFKWHGHYSYHDPIESADTDLVCKFCAFLNDERLLYKSSVYTNIRKYWMY